MRLLLDAHVPSAVAQQLGRRGVDPVHLAHWLGGNYLSAPDEQILATAHSERRILVTFDLRTITPIVKEWAEAGRRHGGVVFVDRNTLGSNDVGGLVRALLELHKDGATDDWQDRVIFLRLV